MNQEKIQRSLSTELIQRHTRHTTIYTNALVLSKYKDIQDTSASVLIPKIKCFQPSKNCSSYFLSKIL